MENKAWLLMGLRRLLVAVPNKSQAQIEVIDLIVQARIAGHSPDEIVDLLESEGLVFGKVHGHKWEWIVPDNYDRVFCRCGALGRINKDRISTYQDGGDSLLLAERAREEFLKQNRICRDCWFRETYKDHWRCIECQIEGELIDRAIDERERSRLSIRRLKEGETLSQYIGRGSFRYPDVEWLPVDIEMKRRRRQWDVSEEELFMWNQHARADQSFSDSLEWEQQ
jgi:hypothetical protein